MTTRTDTAVRALVDALDRPLEDVLVPIAREAGEAILEIYQDAEGVEIDRKADDSPLTQADLASNDVIVDGLEAAAPEIPILSEESHAIAYHDRTAWDLFWLVDPLDGTKEFIKRNGEFTVNIALVAGQRPVAGIVHAPDLGRTYFGRTGPLGQAAAPESQAAGAGQGPAGGDPIAWREGPTPGERIMLEAIEPGPDETVGVVVSRSHLNDATRAFVDELEAKREVELVPSGSSIKFCRIAEGTAHVYPRLAPTMEWDTGAAQAVLEAAGGLVVQAGNDHAGEPLVYNKPDLLNPHFVAAAGEGLLP